MYEPIPKPVRKPKRPRKGLQRSGWHRHTQNLGSISANDLRAQRAAQEKERKARRFALNFGCEYGSWLRAQGPVLGCPLCRRTYGKFVLHHTKTRGAGGDCEVLIFICQRCHNAGHAKGFADMEAAAGVDLRELAAVYAAHGHALGLLPIEQCHECLDFHSRSYMLDRELPDGRTVRVCMARCAPVPEHL